MWLVTGISSSSTPSPTISTQGMKRNKYYHWIIYSIKDQNDMRLVIVRSSRKNNSYLKRPMWISKTKSSVTGERQCWLNSFGIVICCILFAWYNIHYDIIKKSHKSNVRVCDVFPDLFNKSFTRHRISIKFFIINILK